jgi:hypothetical protein
MPPGGSIPVTSAGRGQRHRGDRDAWGPLRLVAAPVEQARVMELTQIQNDEGPLLDCYRTGRSSSSAVSARSTLRRGGRGWPPRRPARWASPGCTRFHAGCPKIRCACASAAIAVLVRGPACGWSSTTWEATVGGSSVRLQLGLVAEHGAGLLSTAQEWRRNTVTGGVAVDAQRESTPAAQACCCTVAEAPVFRGCRPWPGLSPASDRRLPAT